MRLSPRTHLRRTVYLVAPDVRPEPPAKLGLHIFLTGLAALGGVLLLGALSWVFMGMPTFARPVELSVSGLERIATRAFSVVAGLSGIALLVIAYHRQRNHNQANRREGIRLFDERFTTAYTGLGHERAPVRLGAVHTLARLADDAPTWQLGQTCIDVLCAYLRMPYAPKPQEPPAAPREEAERVRAGQLEYGAYREVRQSIVRIITDRLREERGWQGYDFDFTGVVFEKADFSGALFEKGKVDFRECRFEQGRVKFTGAKFRGAQVRFDRSSFCDGDVWFRNAEFSSGQIHFPKCQFTEGSVDFTGADFTGAIVDFTGESEAKDRPPQGPAPRGLLAAVDEITDGDVFLPEEWQTPRSTGHTFSSSPS